MNEFVTASDRDWAEVLAGVPLLAEVGRRKLRKVAQEAHFAEYAPGEAVVLTGAALRDRVVARAADLMEAVEESGALRSC